MKGNFNKFDSQIQDKLVDYTKDPPIQVWSNVKRAMFYKKILAFKFISGSRVLSILTTLGSVALVSTAVVFLSPEEDSINSINTQTKQEENRFASYDKSPAGKEQEMVEVKQEAKTSPEKTDENDPVVYEEINNEEAVDAIEIQEKETARKYKTKVSSALVSSNPKQPSHGFPDKSVLGLRGNPHHYLQAVNDLDKFELFDLSLLQNNFDLDIGGSILLKENQVKSALNSKLFMIIWESPDYIESNMTLNQDVEKQNPYFTKKNAETPEIFYSRGLELMFAKNRFRFVTGFNFSILGESAEYDYKYETIDSVGYHKEMDIKYEWAYMYNNHGVLIDSFLDPRIVTEIVIDRDTVERTGTVSSVNKLKYVEIPLMAGYHFELKKFHVEAMAGVSLSILTGASGKIPSLEPDEFYELDRKSDYLAPYTMSVLLRLNCSYPLNNRFRVLLAPSFKQNIGSVFSSQYAVKQKYLVYGLHGGLIYNF